MPTQRPLVVTDDAELLDEILGLAAVADVEVTTAVDLAGGRPYWRHAPLVLVDATLAPEVAASALPRQPGLAFICRDGPQTAGLRRSWSESADTQCLLPLPAAGQALLDRLAQVESPVPAGRILGVIGGSGGAGASVFAAALALVAARTTPPSWLVDLDPAAGGLDLLLGMDDSGALHWPGLHGASGRLTSAALRDALPVRDGVAALSCDRSQYAEPEPPAVEAVLGAIRASGGVGVVDLPRRATAARAAALSVVDEVCLVVTGEVRATAAARLLVESLATFSLNLRIVVRCLSPRLLEPGQVAATLDAPLAGTYGFEPSVDTALREGRPPCPRRSSLVRLCRSVLGQGRPPRR